MDGVLEEFYEDNDPPYSNYGIYSMEEEPELIDCLTNVIGSNRDLFDVIKEHDCFLNLPEVDIDKNPLNIRNMKDTEEDDPELQRMLQKIQTVILCKILDILGTQFVTLNQAKIKMETGKLPYQDNC